jgi:hypothetical protein
MTRHEVRAWLVEFLLDKVREDRYPSPTHLALIEKWISRDRVHDYLRVLIDKVEQDTFRASPCSAASSAWPSACRAPNTGVHENRPTLNLPPRPPSLEKMFRHPLQTHRTRTNAGVSTAATGYRRRPNWAVADEFESRGRGNCSRLIRRCRRR